MLMTVLCVSQPKRKKPAAAAAVGTSALAANNASSHAPISSLLDAPLDKVMADPWARGVATSPWGDQIDAVTTSQPDVCSSRRSPSPGQILH